MKWSMIPTAFRIPRWYHREFVLESGAWNHRIVADGKLVGRRRIKFGSERKRWLEEDWEQSATLDWIQESVEKIRGEVT